MAFDHDSRVWKFNWNFEACRVIAGSRDEPSCPDFVRVRTSWVSYDWFVKRNVVRRIVKAEIAYARRAGCDKWARRHSLDACRKAGAFHWAIVELVEMKVVEVHINFFIHLGILIVQYRWDSSRGRIRGMQCNCCVLYVQLSSTVRTLDAWIWLDCRD